MQPFRTPRSSDSAPFIENSVTRIFPFTFFLICSLFLLNYSCTESSSALFRFFSSSRPISKFLSSFTINCYHFILGNYSDLWVKTPEIFWRSRCFEILNDLFQRMLRRLNFCLLLADASRFRTFRIAQSLSSSADAAKQNEVWVFIF